MRLQDYKLIFVAIGLIGVLLIASPAIEGALCLPGGERFSELYLLGPTGLAENYPNNITTGQNYSIYVDVGNHLGASAYYMVYVKLCNETDLLPNATTGTPCSASSSYEFRFSVPDNKVWESPLTFCFNSVTIWGNESVVNQLTINNFTLGMNKPSVWDSSNAAFNYQLVFELWLYNSTLHMFQFNDRYVNLQLGLTQTQ